jgi:stage II sporulation protein D
VKRTIIISILLIAAALLLPLLFLRQNATEWDLFSKEDAGSSEEESADTPDQTQDTELLDAAITLTAQINGEPVATTMAEYLPGVLAAEMPATFELEALKAQAIAARTYILYRMQGSEAAHPDANVCDDFNCCAAYLTVDELRENWGEAFDSNWAKIQQAVQETSGQYMVYEEEPIQAVFHSSSAGKTEDSSNIWGDQPYLVSVDSPETEAKVPNFIASTEVSANEFRTVILTADQNADLSGDVSEWVGEVKTGETGRVDYAIIGGVSFSGTALRELFGLRSTAFTLDYGGGQFVFTTTGYGHGVGMSQYGANVLAEEGQSCEEILLHYYSGVSIVT